MTEWRTAAEKAQPELETRRLLVLDLYNPPIQGELLCCSAFLFAFVQLQGSPFLSGKARTPFSSSGNDSAFLRFVGSWLSRSFAPLDPLSNDPPSYHTSLATGIVRQGCGRWMVPKELFATDLKVRDEVPLYTLALQPWPLIVPVHRTLA